MWPRHKCYFTGFQSQRDKWRRAAHFISMSGASFSTWLAFYHTACGADNQATGNGGKGYKIKRRQSRNIGPGQAVWQPTTGHHMSHNQTLWTAILRYMRVCTPRYELQALTVCSPDHNVTRAWLPLQICERLKLYFCNVGKTQLRNDRRSPQREHTSVMGAMQERQSTLNLEATLFFFLHPKLRNDRLDSIFYVACAKKSVSVALLRNVPFFESPECKSFDSAIWSDAFPLCAFFICNIKVNRNLSDEICTTYQHAARARKK